MESACQAWKQPRSFVGILGGFASPRPLIFYLLDACGLRLQLKETSNDETGGNLWFSVEAVSYTGRESISRALAARPKLTSMA